MHPHGMQYDEDNDGADLRGAGGVIEPGETSTYTCNVDEEEGQEAGLMHAMNGYIFGNLTGLEVNRDDRVRWHLIGMGTEVDLRTGTARLCSITEAARTS
jgi:hypothetical protein